MNDSIMAYGDVIADDGRAVGLRVNRAIVLYIGISTDVLYKIILMSRAYELDKPTFRI
jgi:hypothetical protein